MWTEKINMFSAQFLVFFCMALEKAMAPHSSTLVWKIPWTEEPGRILEPGIY